jgi:hypothetical protein
MGGGGPASFAAIGPCVSAVSEVERPAQRVAHMFDGPFKPLLGIDRVYGPSEHKAQRRTTRPRSSEVAGLHASRLHLLLHPPYNIQFLG